MFDRTGRGDQPPDAGRHRERAIVSPEEIEQVRLELARRDADAAPEPRTDELGRAEEEPRPPDQSNLRWNPYEHRWVEAMPNADRAILDDRKFRSYTMDPGNPHSGGKHKAWERLGYDVTDDRVRDELSGWVTRIVLDRVKTAEIVDQGPHARGHTYELHFEISGDTRSNKTGKLVTIWLRESVRGHLHRLVPPPVRMGTLHTIYSNRESPHPNRRPAEQPVGSGSGVLDVALEDAGLGQPG